VGLRDHKLTFIEQPICTHEHPCRGKVPEDATYTRAGKYFGSDELVFKVRKTAGFP
jgi:hypothetical protein